MCFGQRRLGIDEGSSDEIGAEPHVRLELEKVRHLAQSPIHVSGTWSATWRPKALLVCSTNFVQGSAAKMKKLCTRFGPRRKTLTRLNYKFAVSSKLATHRTGKYIRSKLSTRKSVGLAVSGRPHALRFRLRACILLDALCTGHIRDRAPGSQVIEQVREHTLVAKSVYLYYGFFADVF